ncbi:MAG: hypothetical protein Unbinned202contig1002_21 [Prokaryotic dsDNA virus sp.]|nr:MAG: hypothetical protein Unbinned202contig1002_21 [Prokaryotic dsDNA virus sp.]|tara:strand:+ start:10014 stop:10796 length:783 start_codon:yes stop_codon:yes gene_type:complete
MAKTFYYDDKNVMDLTLGEGTFGIGSGLLVFSAGSAVSNQERLIDQSTSLAITSFQNTSNNAGDAVVIPFGANTKLDFLAVYMSASEAGDLKFGTENATNNQYTERLHFSSTFSAGWTVGEFSEQSSDNWMLYTFNADLDNFTEFITGEKLVFSVNPEMGTGEAEEFNTEINTSIGGVEYAVKTGNPKTTISMNFSSIGSTFKGRLESMQENVQNYKKFIYSEDGTTGPFHYVRLAKPIDFKEVSYNRYSCSIDLIEQLS